jgi:hypothetical protein
MVFTSRHRQTHEKIRDFFDMDDVDETGRGGQREGQRGGKQ